MEIETERHRIQERQIENCFTCGEGGGGGGGYTVGADILSSADWYHHSIICGLININKLIMEI